MLKNPEALAGDLLELGKVKIGAGVSVGRSGMSGVRVGVKVTGVGVNVANRSRVGMRVTVGTGVSVSGGAGGVGVAINSKIGDNPEHPLRRIVNNAICKYFFMKNPSPNLLIYDSATGKRNFVARDHRAPQDGETDRRGDELIL